VVRFSLTVWTALALLIGANQSAVAVTKSPTFYVGTCKPGKADYTTIQAAVSAVPPGSTINVCPGVYPEQVTINHPLTLQGVQSGNNAQVMITAPAGGVLIATVPVALPVIAMVSVSNSGGAVDISGLTVDGTGITNPGIPVTGILYDSSPGTLAQVVVQNLALTNTETIGIALRDDNAASPAILVQNSTVSFPQSSNSEFVRTEGLFAETAIVSDPARLTSGGNFIQGLLLQLTTGTTTVSNNNVASSNAGILLTPPVGATTINGNHLITPANIPQGFGLVRGVGIEFNCATPVPTTSGNTFIGALVGLADVPSGSSLQKNAGTFINVPNVEQLCQ
jgi:nitrous oxidase accessory protein NosD